MNSSERILQLFLAGLTFILLSFNALLGILDHKYPPLKVTSLANKDRVHELLLASKVKGAKGTYEQLSKSLSFSPRNARAGLVNPYSNSRAILLTSDVKGLQQPALLITEKKLCNQGRSTHESLIGTVVVQLNFENPEKICVCLKGKPCSETTATV